MVAAILGFILEGGAEGAGVGLGGGEAFQPRGDRRLGGGDIGADDGGESTPIPTISKLHDQTFRFCQLFLIRVEREELFCP